MPDAETTIEFTRIDRPTVTWDGRFLCHVHAAEPPESSATSDGITQGVTATARALPPVNGVRYGRDPCPDCDQSDRWRGYAVYTTVADHRSLPGGTPDQTPDLVRALVCGCGNTVAECHDLSQGYMDDEQ